MTASSSGEKCLPSSRDSNSIDYRPSTIKKFLRRIFSYPRKYAIHVCSYVFTDYTGELDLAVYGRPRNHCRRRYSIISGESCGKNTFKEDYAICTMILSKTFVFTSSSSAHFACKAYDEVAEINEIQE